MIQIIVYVLLPILAIVVWYLVSWRPLLSIGFLSRAGSGLEALMRARFTKFDKMQQSYRNIAWMPLFKVTISYQRV